MTPRIGFMQGRLSAQVDGKIQAFPWDEWEKEFFSAQGLGFDLMEWTIDQDRLRENPLMTSEGRARIRELTHETGVAVESLTGDCFMQAPFYKETGAARRALLDDLEDILSACGEIGVRYVLVPLVDNGSVESLVHESALRGGLLPLRERLVRAGMKIVFELDMPPDQAATFMLQFPADAFGVNYDIGNSASLGFDTAEEIAAYGERIDNVHVKDRVLGGTTVPLGTGNADFLATFRGLRSISYRGNLILQTARAAEGDHAEVLSSYRTMTAVWWVSSGS